MIGLNYLGKMGQLGNQMFQYAAIKGIARNRGYQFTVPQHNESLRDSLGNILRIELFDVFDIRPDQTGYLHSNGLRTELDFEFDEELFNTCIDGVCLSGYFQTEKYFKHIKDDILKEFTFKKEYYDACAEIQPMLDNPIALHIRRGDFLINSGNHYNLSLSYYENALKEFDGNRQVVIFSDDIEWCKKQELFSDDRFLVSEENSSYVDLCLMTLCDDYIIANSTFSWWGSWLSQNPNKTVIYPDKWFGSNNADKSIKDLFPSEWRMVNEN
tara:strand:+ start:1174 stop:1983 length:810 start_codon:yes stop_codon:yes gene_type:complete